MEGLAFMFIAFPLLIFLIGFLAKVLFNLPDRLNPLDLNIGPIEDTVVLGVIIIFVGSWIYYFGGAALSLIWFVWEKI